MTETNMTPGPDTLPSPQPGRPGRGLRLALALSVALNLAVVGVIAGLALHGGPDGRGTMLRDMGFGPYEGALRPEDRDAMRGALRGRLGEIREARQQMQQDMQLILQALRADPFDPEALSLAMASQADHLNERLRFGSEVVRDHLLRLTDDERRQFADRMEGHMRRGADGGAEGKDAPEGGTGN
jgi:uncharacterized membrane protein